MSKVDTELSQLNIPAVLRANAAFMKILIVLFHYGNQSMDANQLVLGIETLKLLQIKGDIDETIREIIATGHRQARTAHTQPPLNITRAKMGRPTRYSISKETMNGIQPVMTKLPQDCGHSGMKRTRKATTFYTPSTHKPNNNNNNNHNNHNNNNTKKPKKKKTIFYLDEDDFDYSSFVFGGSEEKIEEVVEQKDTIADYSLLYSPPTRDMDYIEPIQFSQYPTAAHFAIVQQKGYSYPRFRSHEKIKIPKANCEDKFRVTDIKRKSTVVGRLFILADGHGGPGCSEYFVRHTPEAVERLCENYTSEWTEKLKNNFQTDVKRMILRLDEDYLYRKRKELEQDEDVDNDGCTLILNIFLGDWMINVNVGDSRTILISAPIPMPGKPDLVNTDGVLGMDNDYKMDVVFASQDHKPYLEHLAREILENGGEFVDSVQNRVIKVEVDKLREDRLAKRGSLKNARIRPKGHEVEGEMERIPSLNVARSCGDLDFKMNPAHKIISCEPDVTFIKIKKVKKRHFLFMSTDGTFDYMYEETADKQNRAIAKMIGTMIEKGERAGKYLLEEDESEYNDNQRKDCNPRVIIESMEEDGSQSSDQSDNQEPGIPLLYRELTEEETYTRKIKERTLIHSARYFANREGAQTFFASTLQDYDDCTIILVEI